MCKKCDFKCKSHTELKKHERTDHKHGFNASDESILYIKQSTRNNSLSEDEINSLLDVSGDETKQITLEEGCQTPTAQKPESYEANTPKVMEPVVRMDNDDLVCNKCDFKGKDVSNLRKHTATHLISENDIDKLGGSIMTEHFCTLCQFVTDNREDLSMHYQTMHEPNTTKVHGNISEEIGNVPAKNSTEVSPKYHCGKCEFSVEDKGDLDLHIDATHNPSKEGLSDAIYENEVNDGESVPILSASTKCKKCPKVFENEGAIKKHIQDDHIIMNVFNCKTCEYKTTIREEFGVHVEASHPPVQAIACERCAFTANDLKVIEMHKQASHMSAKVNLDVDDQNVIVCDQCDYKCKYNIQLKKHRQNSHKSSAKYKCKACNFTTEFIGSSWEHVATDHPELADELTPEQRENFILKIVAEQTTNIWDEMESLKRNTNNALVEINQTLKTYMDNIIVENGDKCKTLGNSVVKLYNKMNRIEKALGQGKPLNAEKKKSVAKVAGRGKGKNSSMKQKKADVPSSVPTSGPTPTASSSGPTSAMPSTTSSASVPAAGTNCSPRIVTNYMQQAKVLYIGDSVGHTANLRNP